MKLHGLKVFGLILALGLSVNVSAIQVSAAEKEAQIIACIDTKDIGQLKQQCTSIQQDFPGEWKEIHRNVSDYIRLVRSQKITQVSKNLNRSRKMACVKACLWTSLGAIPACRNYVNLIKRHFLSLLLAYPKDKKKLAEMIDSAITALPALAVPFIMYLSSSWTYENAHFAWYGNTKLLQEIRTLDEMLKYVHTVA